MKVFLLELKKNRRSLMLWSGAIAGMMGLCVVIYPQMGEQLAYIGDMFADMGLFSQAFGLDVLNFGEFTGYFAVECGNVLGLGGAIFAAAIGIAALAGEEHDRTAEFLLSHPISRQRIAAQKLLAVFSQVLILNIVSIVISMAGAVVIGEGASIPTMLLITAGSALMHLEIAAITFGISAFIRSRSTGMGIGLALGLYFMNIIPNIMTGCDFLKYFTPFGYADGSAIVSSGLNPGYLAAGMLLGALAVAAGLIYYKQKDIAC